jgi:hypothetical protein
VKCQETIVEGGNLTGKCKHFRKRKEVNVMSMIRWEPIRELMSLRQAMDRLFEERFVRPSPFLGLVGEAKKPAASSILAQIGPGIWAKLASNPC